MTLHRKKDEERGERIKYVRTEILGLRAQEALARLMSENGKTVTRGAVGNWELGKEIGLDSLTTLSQLSGVNLEWIAYNKGEKPQKRDLQELTIPVILEPANAQITGTKLQRGHIIPLYGAAVGGEDGEFILNGNHLDDVFAPPSLSGIPEAYACRVVGDSMSPRYDDNDTVYVNPKRRAVKGDYVVAQIRVDEHAPPFAYIKKLVHHTSKKLILEQFNPPKILEFDGEMVETVHYVLRPGE
jgi:phage repressor protein C with HTH and peptisase S24 domain